MDAFLEEELEDNIGLLDAQSYMDNQNKKTEKA